MKLIRCQIENFGILSNYSYQFEDGLTVIYEPNGYGKSTLAAFIKAMFYGLPARGSRNAVENERKRYEPWQGGTYGGYLDFEHQGTVYRITRIFGQTAAKDSCEIKDLTNRKPCVCFSSRVGEELFQLDAESFSRSIFLSASDQSISATTSIRTKLSDLVDNTNDLNNYDTAVSNLRQKRAQYQAYRGNSGSVPKTSEEIEQAKQKLFLAEEQYPRLAELEQEIDAKENTIAVKNGAIRNLRQKINAASVQEARRSQQKQLHEIRQELDRFGTQLQEIERRYPNGFPSREEIEQQHRTLSVIEQTNKALNTAVVSNHDLEIVEQERDTFTEPSRVREDLDACQLCCVELEAVSAKLTSQMLPEELQRMEELHGVFHDTPLTEEELLSCGALADEIKDKERRLDGLSLSSEEQSKMRELSRMFASGEPSMELIGKCEKQQQEIAGFRERKRALTLSEAEDEEYRALSRVFASGIPSEQEITKQQQASRRIAELTGIKNTKTAIPQNKSEEKSSSKVPVLIGMLSALFVLGGILCFILSKQIPGIILLVAGFAGALLALLLHVRGVDAKSNSSQSLVVGSAITDRENQELYDIQHGLNDFLLHFYHTAAEPDKQLTQLFVNRGTYLALCKKKEHFDQECEEVDREIQKRTQFNYNLFEQYYPNQPYSDDFTNDLMLKYHIYTELKNRMQGLNAERDRLIAEMDACCQTLQSVILRYYPAPLSDTITAAQRLISEAQEYEQLQSKQRLMLQGNQRASVRRDELITKIEYILSSYAALIPDKPYSDCLQQIRRRFEAYQESAFRVNDYEADRKAALEKKTDAERELAQFFSRYGLDGADCQKAIQLADDDARTHEAMQERLKEAERKMKEFRQDHPNVEEEAVEFGEALPDVNALQLAEESTQQEVERIQSDVRGLRQEYDSICRIVEEIPEFQDRIARLSDAMNQDKERVRLLDKTIQLLEEAKNLLATLYVGQVEQNFRHYAEILFDGTLGEAMVDCDLGLSIAEQGRQREVGSFSTGTIERIVVCMRMALVDALFTKEQPFVILDDPFVYLDDASTSRSLEMIRKLAKDRQVIYLVCNSSRC